MGYHAHPASYKDAGDPDFNPYACITSALPDEWSPLHFWVKKCSIPLDIWSTSSNFDYQTLSIIIDIML